jgi:hypothetical protein
MKYDAYRKMDQKERELMGGGLAEAGELTWRWRRQEGQKGQGGR